MSSSVQYPIRVCVGPACSAAFSKDILKAVEDYLHICSGEVTPDGVFSLEGVHCFGQCQLGPNVEVGGKFYHHCSVVRVRELLSHCEKMSQGGGDGFLVSVRCPYCAVLLSSREGIAINLKIEGTSSRAVIRLCSLRWELASSQRVGRGLPHPCCPSCRVSLRDPTEFCPQCCAEMVVLEGEGGDSVLLCPCWDCRLWQKKAL